MIKAIEFDVGHTLIKYDNPLNWSSLYRPALEKAVKDVGYRKPNSAGYIKLLYFFDVAPDEMLYVGDEEKDIVGANNLDIPSVLVNRSNDIKDYGQKYTVSSLREIINYLS